LPDEVRVRDWLVVVFSWTVPKLRLDELRARPAVAALSCKAAVAVTPFAVAVIVAVCAVVTAVTVAVNAAVVDPLATVTDAGTVTELLLLARFTVSPLPVAAEVRTTVQASLAAPVSELLLQATALSAAGAWPVPLRPIVAVPPEGALLLIVTAPVAAPEDAGSKLIATVIACPGFRVRGRVCESPAGRVTPAIAKPLPEIAAEEMTSAALPDEVSVNDCVVVVFSWTVPKLRVDELKVMPGAAELSCNAVLADVPLAVAVIVAACALVTADTVAVKAAALDPLGTIIEAGTATALLLLARFTVRPPLGAPAVSVTVHASIPAEDNDPLAQVTALGAGGMRLIA
jgi:hypothetical protein